MAALLIALSIMAVMLTMAMPVWHQLAQREKEEELIFRGQQYARAIGLFERKYANTPPPSLDVLVQEHFLRKKFKDPITGQDFVPITAGQAAVPAGQGGAAGRGGGAAAPPGQGGAAGRGGGAAAPLGQFGQALVQGPQPARGGVGGAQGLPGAGVTGGIIGVTSASKDKSLRIYNGATHYNEWRFVYAPPAPTPGAGAPGANPAQGQRGGQPGQPGQGGLRGAPFGRARGGQGPGGGPNPGGQPAGPGPTAPGRPNNPGGGRNLNPAQPFPFGTPGR